MCLQISQSLSWEIMQTPKIASPYDKSPVISPLNRL
jgi:hypothetical protein